MSDLSGHYKFPYFHDNFLTERRVELIKGFIIFLIIGIIFGIYHLVSIVGKCIVANIISQNNELSDEKTKAITEMMSKDITIVSLNRNS